MQEANIKIVILTLIGLVVLSSCVSISYNPTTKEIKYASLLKDIEAEPVYVKLPDGTTLRIGKLKSDVSEVIAETIGAVKAGAILGGIK